MNEEHDNTAIPIAAVMTELRRTAVNFFEAHGHRCEVDDECNRFATWTRVARDVSMHACDSCIDEARRLDDRAESKGCGTRPEYKERDDATQVRELLKAVQAIGAFVDSKMYETETVHGIVRRMLSEVDARLAKGKGTWPSPDYVRDDDWARWLGEASALRAVLDAE